MEGVSRRDFLKVSAGTFAAWASGSPWASAAANDKIRIALIGCGGRGTNDARKCLLSAEGVELVAMADLFKDRLVSALAGMKADLGEKIKVEEKKDTYVGFDAYKKIMERDDVSLVLLTTPPHFRAEHLRTAVEAGKHVFMEKPVAVDPVGVRSIIASSEQAEKKGLTLLAGTQMRRNAQIEEVVKRIQDGAIGEIVAGQCVRLGDGMMDWGVKERKPEWTEMEWQIRRWLFYTWLSGDFIAEMHVHDLDIMNWAMNAHPVNVMAMGGRDVRTDPIYGDSFDHFAGEYEYPNGVRVGYLGRQMDRCSTRLDHWIFGTKGSAYIDFANSTIKGETEYRYEQPSPDPEIRQHADQIQAIREGKPLNEGRQIAESSLTSIMGRMSAYTGNKVSWDWALDGSKLDLSPAKYEFGDLPVPAIAVPGKTPLV